MGRDSATSLAPGFRFHPTDEELVRYYLRRKVSGKIFRFDAISEVDVYKNEPWDLPSKSKLKTRDLEWYFFSVLDKKYGNGWRTNRATEKGYWKTTGKDRPVHHNSRTVGMKKTLVYHSGRAPHGQRTNWVMHEYRLADEELEKSGISQDAYVLCRIFQKSGPGPKNGERYGAPFNEEEWEDENEVAYFPGEEAPVDDDVKPGDDVHFDVDDDLNKRIDAGQPSENHSLPPNFYYGETSSYIEYPRVIIKDNQNPVIGTVETDDDLALDLPGNELEVSTGHQLASISVKDEYVDESNNVNPVGDFLLDEPYFDATDNPSLGDGLFLETNDPSKADALNLDSLDGYLTFFDMDNESLQNMGFDSTSPVASTENSIPDKPSCSHKLDKEATEKACLPNEAQNGTASSSKQIPEEVKSGIDYPFVKQATHIMGNMPAPLSFSADFQSKDALRRLHAASSSSSSVHVTAGIIRITDTAAAANETDWPYTKNRNVNIFLSIPLSDIHPYKTEPSMLWGLAYFMFSLLLILFVSFKVGMSVYAR